MHVEWFTWPILVRARLRGLVLISKSRPPLHLKELARYELNMYYIRLKDVLHISI